MNKMRWFFSCWTADLKSSLSLDSEGFMAWRETGEILGRNTHLLLLSDKPHQLQVENIWMQQVLRRSFVSLPCTCSPWLSAFGHQSVCLLLCLFVFPGQSTNAVPGCRKLCCGVPSSSLNCRGWPKESARLKRYLGKICQWLTANLANFSVFI